MKLTKLANYHSLFINICIPLLFFSCSNTFERKVEISVTEQLSIFPKSRLQDIYKNFFQDRYGQEVFLSDTANTSHNLRKEVESCSKAYMKMVEPIGWEKNYCRVSTHALKLDYIPYSVYYDAYMKSIKDSPEISLYKWKEEWSNILSVIDRMNLNLSDYEKDKAEITRLLNSGSYIIEHSDDFIKSYNPNYRVIRKDIYTKMIEPYLVE